jgi:hypothetical protein
LCQHLLDRELGYVDEAADWWKLAV